MNKYKLLLVLFPLAYFCLYMCVHVHVCTCALGGKRLTISVFFNCSPHFLRCSLSINLELANSARLVGQQTSAFFPSLLSSALRSQARTTMPGYLHGFWEPNAVVQHLLGQTEPSNQSSFVYFSSSFLDSILC